MREQLIKDMMSLDDVSCGLFGFPTSAMALRVQNDGKNSGQEDNTSTDKVDGKNSDAEIQDKHIGHERTVHHEDVKSADAENVDKITNHDDGKSMNAIHKRCMEARKQAALLYFGFRPQRSDGKKENKSDTRGFVSRMIKTHSIFDLLQPYCKSDIVHFDKMGELQLCQTVSEALEFAKESKSATEIEFRADFYNILTDFFRMKCQDTLIPLDKLSLKEIDEVIEKLIPVVEGEVYDPTTTTYSNDTITSTTSGDATTISIGRSRNSRHGSHSGRSRHGGDIRAATVSHPSPRIVMSSTVDMEEGATDIDAIFDSTEKAPEVCQTSQDRCTIASTSSDSSAEQVIDEPVIFVSLSRSLDSASPSVQLPKASDDQNVSWNFDAISTDGESSMSSDMTRPKTAMGSARSLSSSDEENDIVISIDRKGMMNEDKDLNRSDRRPRSASLFD
jgi:hypothetical protein